MAVVGAACLVALAIPGVASAAQRYAGPGGAGATCTIAAPCDFQTAVNNATTNDEVIVLPGDLGTPALPSATSVFSSAAISIHGQDGAPRPRVYVGGNFGLSLSNAGASIRDLEIVQAPTSGWSLRLSGGASAERMALSGVGCQVDSNATLMDTSCPGLAITSGSGGTVTLRNVTIISPTSNAGLSTGVATGVLTVNATNVIARSAAGTIDVFAGANPGATATINMDHSNYGTRSMAGQGGGTSSVTDPTTGANQTAAPLLASATDYHELPGSPTIDAGAPRSAADLDFDRDPRMLGAATDIGADEFVDHTPVATTGAAGAIAATSATLNGSVDPSGLDTTARFAYGTTTAYGLLTPAQAFGGLLIGGQALSAVVSGLSPATTYHFRTVASNAFGSPAGTDATFTTAAAPPGPLGAVAAAKAPKLTLSARKRSLQTILKARGFLVSVKCDVACSVKATAKLGKKSAGSGKRALAARKASLLRIKLTKTAIKALRHRRSATFVVAITATATAGGKKTKKTIKVTAKRT